ncbi:MAG: MBOAT family O-acyltransferase [Marivibrio sp.]|uniref:MBOAT family O-acyltransferase n=1 Tax=Marivibrio sp. TaxID=2039719 RepID=UPI0032EDE377
MIFNDFAFLFLFLPAVLMLFYAPFLRPYRVATLTLASFVFYGFSGLEHALVLAFDIAWIYLVCRSPRFPGDRVRLAVAIIPPILALVYYKYLGFILGSMGLSPPSGAVGPEAYQGLDILWDVALPAGVSFFTFQVVSYAIDRYRMQVAEPPPFRRFALYVSFFPQLVAGPIVRFEQVADALKSLTRFRPSAEQLYTGVVYIVCGLALKVLLADSLARSLAPFVEAPDNLGLDASLFLIFGYSFQIYFDFYGYSLAAIGLGLLFGVRLPLNFLRPYEALNPREFWRRWHVTLSYWIRDYLYRPLGGNERYSRNILIVFAVCGLWHGAGWTFVIWGLYHAVLVAGYRLVRPAWDALPRALQWAGSFSLVSAGWLLFVFDFSGMQRYAASLGTPGALSASWTDWAVLLIAAAVCFGPSVEKLAEAPPLSKGRAAALAACGAALAFATLMFVSVSDSFIYFRF